MKNQALIKVLLITIILLNTALLSNSTTANTHTKEESAFSGWYHLKTQARGKESCLEGNQASSFAYNGAAFMSKYCSRASGQLWKIVPVGNGYYHLKTQFRGENECLDCNSRSSVHNGAAFMGKCKPIESQLWQIEPVGNGYYRLKTRMHGQFRCLEANSLSARGPAAYMANCKNVTGQFWKLEKVK